MRVSSTVFVLTVLFLTGNGLAASPDPLSRQPGDAFDLPALELPPMLNPISDITLPLTAKEKAALALQRAFHDRNVPPVMTDNGRVTYAFGLTTPSVVCAPFQVSDIELQAGEFVNDIVMGDTARWKFTLARSGSPEASHLIVKPLDAGLETTVVVTTDRRVYHMQLKSQPKGHMTYVGFVYPEDAENALQQQITAQRKRDNWKTANIPAVASGTYDEAQLDEAALSKLHTRIQDHGDGQAFGYPPFDVVPLD